MWAKGAFYEEHRQSQYVESRLHFEQALLAGKALVGELRIGKMQRRVLRLSVAKVKAAWALNKKHFCS